MVNRSFLCGLIFLASLSGILFYTRADHPLVFSQNIGMQIWRNECAGTKAGLTSWNEGEQFASLGIGHFIWYPEGTTGPFGETFPSLLEFFKKKKVELPDWLAQAKGCPWATREAFLQAQKDLPMQQLRDLLADHVDLQVLFMLQRVKRALPMMVSRLDPERQRQITFQFYRLAHTPEGVYVLLDYLNFKGEGVKAQELYRGQGWGLLQVLERMNGTMPGEPAIKEFISAGKDVLSERVANSPPERKESRWLKGWHNRLDSYQSFRS